MSQSYCRAKIFYYRSYGQPFDSILAISANEEKIPIIIVVRSVSWNFSRKWHGISFYTKATVFINVKPNYSLDSVIYTDCICTKNILVSKKDLYTIINNDILGKGNIDYTWLKEYKESLIPYI